MRKSIPLLFACALATLPAAKPAYADGFYGSASFGLAAPADFSFPDATYTYSGTTYHFTNDRSSFKTAVACRGEIGCMFQDFRAGVEVGSAKPGLDRETFYFNDTVLSYIPISGSFSVLSFMLNGYYDIPTSKGYSPYIMAGLGVAKVKADNATSDSIVIAGTSFSQTRTLWATTDESVGAWQAGFGAAIPVRRGVQLDLGYRYFSTGTVRLNSSVSGKLHSSNLLAGLRFEL